MLTYKAMLYLRYHDAVTQLFLQLLVNMQLFLSKSFKKLFFPFSRPHLRTCQRGLASQ